MLFLHTLCLTVLLLLTAAQPINVSLVYPDVPAPPIPTKYYIMQELSSWQTIQIFTTLLNAHPFLIPQNRSLILAPTNHAFIKLLSRLAPQMGNPFSTAASITDTLDKLINTGNLTRILAYHIIPRDLIETDLRDGYLTVSGGVVSFTDFPDITDIDPVTQPRRLYRQVSSTKGMGGSFMFLSDVLLPLPLEVIVPGAGNLGVDDDEFPGKGQENFPGMRNETFPAMDDNGTFPGVGPNGTVGEPPFPPDNNSSNLFSMILDALSPALSQKPFVSNGVLIASRTDLQIMNALIRLIPEVNWIATSAPAHILAPTDTAFINLFLNLSKKLDIPDLSLPEISDPGFLSNLTEILKISSAAESIWSSIAGLPSLAQIVSYHIISKPADYASLMNMSRSAPVATMLQNYSLVFQRDSIIDADSSRVDARPIASFPTLTGYVTPIDGVLTPLDTSVVGSILDGAMGSPTPSPTSMKEDDNPACFPVDGVVYTKHGVTKMGDLMGGDEIRVDEAVERHSAVFMFTHKNIAGTHDFVRISTAAGYNITLTSGHYMYSKRSLIAAGNIRVGDMLRTIGGESAVTKVEYVRARGLVAPHTVDGGLIVDGVLVSGYSRAVHPWIAHALLLPVRWYIKVTGAVEPFGGMFYRGGRGLERLLPTGALEYNEWA